GVQTQRRFRAYSPTEALHDRRHDPTRACGAHEHPLTTAVAIILAVVALGGSGLALLALHAWRRSHAPPARSLLETTSRLAALARQLDDALDRLRKEARITIALGDIGASPDLADVLTRVAAAA